jgi:hypothetical protein
MRKPTSEKSTAKKAPASVPGWAMKTPDEIEYYLEMYDPNSEPLQNILVTRDEFEALKKHLAKMRGIAIPKAA